MAYIKIKLDCILMDGHVVTFKAPCDCTAIEGLKVCYIENNALQEKIFSMKDTHGNVLTGLGNLFTAGAYVKVILDTNDHVAYLQNADTNGYLESVFAQLDAKIDSTLATAITETTDSTLAHSHNGVIKVLGIYGNTEQYGTSGAQLFDASNVVVSSNTSINVSNNGYTIVAVGGSAIGYAHAKFISLDIEKIKGKTVYIACDKKSQTGKDGRAQITVVYADGSKSFNGFYADSASSKVSVNIPEDVSDAWVEVSTNNTGTAKETDNTVTFEGLRVVLDENAEWEPYTGGQPSPNPDYPQEIRSVKGKNLLEITATSQTKNGVTFTVNADGSVVANGTASSDAYFRINSIILEKGVNYVLSGCPSGGADGMYNMYFDQLNADGTSIDDGFDYGNGVTFAVADSCTAINVGLVIRKSQSVSNLVFKPMIRRASVADPTYVPYGCLRVKAHGSNFLNLPESDALTQNGITANIENGRLKVSGTATADAWFNIWPVFAIGTNETQKNSTPFKAKGKCVVRSLPSNGVRVSFKNDIEQTPTETLETFNKSLQLQNDFTRVFIYIQNGATANLDSIVAITETADTEAEPYTENSITLSQPIELNGIGDVRDELTPDGVVRRIGKAVFDGSADEDWSVYSDPVGVRYFTRRNGVNLDNLKIIKSIGSHHMMCQKSNIGNFADEQYVRTDGVNVTFDFNFKVGYITDDSTDNLRTWLAENPITVVYELATQVTEPLPAADQIALRSLLSCDGATYLECDSEVAPTIKVQYGTSAVGAIALENSNLHEVNEILRNRLETKVESCLTADDFTVSGETLILEFL